MDSQLALSIDHDDPDVEVVNISTMNTYLGMVQLQDDALYEIQLEESAPELERGTRVVLNLRAPPQRLTGTIIRREDGLIAAQTHKTPAPDERYFPRMAGGIDLRYRCGKLGEASRWMSGKEVNGDFRTPDPFMNFSVTGLRFDDSAHCETGDTLLLDFSLPNTETRWRAVGRVVRVSELPETELDDALDDTTHQVAVRFTDLPESAAAALEAFTIRLQRAMVGDDDSAASQVAKLHRSDG